jgi:hypothetical protein
MLQKYQRVCSCYQQWQQLQLQDKPCEIQKNRKEKKSNENLSFWKLFTSMHSIYM